MITESDIDECKEYNENCDVNWCKLGTYNVNIITSTKK